MNPQLNEILGNTPLSAPLFDNWFTAFAWLVVAIVVFAIIALYLNLKRGIRGENVNKGALPFIKWPLLLASAGFNVFFTYYVFLPAGQAVAMFAAVVMGGVNLAEAYLVRLIIATWRHEMKLIFKLALVFTIPVFIYSLMAAGSAFSTMMMKNKDSLVASQLELQAAKDRIKGAESAVNEVQIGAQSNDILNALYQTNVRNSRGTLVNFADIKTSCERGGWYARNYPALCNQYLNVKDGTHTAANVAAANTKALTISANEKEKMAEIIKDRPPEITPTLLGFGLGIAAVGFIVSLALESAIIGVGFFEELFVRPTPLPAIVQFMNKSLDWDADSIKQRGLQVDVSPSSGTIGFSNDKTLVSPFSSSGFGWKQNAPKQERGNATVPKRDNTHVLGGNVTVPKHNATVPERKNGEEQAQLKAIKERLAKASNAKVGEMIECVTCGNKTEKRIDTKRFCSAKCRTDFHKLTKKQNAAKNKQ